MTREELLGCSPAILEKMSDEELLSFFKDCLTIPLPESSEERRKIIERIDEESEAKSVCINDLTRSERKKEKKKEDKKKDRVKDMELLRKMQEMYEKL